MVCRRGSMNMLDWAPVSPNGAPPVAGTTGQGDAAPVLAQVEPDPASHPALRNGGTANLPPVAAAPAEGAEILSRADSALADPASAPLAAPAMLARPVRARVSMLAV